MKKLFSDPPRLPKRPAFAARAFEAVQPGDDAVLEVAKGLPHADTVDEALKRTADVIRHGAWLLGGAAVGLRRGWPAALLVAAVQVAGSGTEILVKVIAQRPRPEGRNADADNPNDAYSFPSGHTLIAFGVAIVIGRAIPSARLPLLGLAAATAVSRVYLGLHYASDVLAAAALGTAEGVLLSSISIERKRRRRPFAWT